MRVLIKHAVTVLVVTVIGIPLSIKLIGYIGVLLNDRQDARKVESALRASQQDRTIAYIKRQPANGLSESKFTPDFLSGFSSWVESLSPAAGGDRTGNKATYIAAPPHKLALVRLKLGDTTQKAVILGIVGSESVRVTCSNDAGGRIAFASGACGEKIREAFGVTLSGVGPL